MIFITNWHVISCILIEKQYRVFKAVKKQT